ncbi:MAG: ankyrin repeat domain-containing protein [Alphaproteobacteria bacterium]|nr:ankyrin repeat domain-containing protein [Alphaproteobacteria bacterium]
MQEQFFKAVKENKLEEVKSLLKQGADVYSFNEEGYTALMVAAKEGLIPMIDLLVQNGANMYQLSQKQNELGYLITAMDIASRTGQKDAYLHLSSLDARHSGQYRCYSYALRQGDDLKLEHEILHDWYNDVNAQSPDGGKTILMTAAQNSSFLLVEKLINLHAKVNQKDRLLKTPLHYACENNRGSLVARGYQLDPKIEEQHHKHNRYYVAKILIEKGADVNAKDFEGKTPLSNFLMNNDFEIADLLLKNGADVTIKDHQNGTILEKAILTENQEMVLKILAHGADIQEEGFEGKTALQYAFVHQRWEMFDLLLKHGADVNKPFKNGDRLLHQIIRIGYLDVAENLLKAGADVMAQDHHGLTALKVANYLRRERMFDLLLQYKDQPQKIASAKNPMSQKDEGRGERE